MLDLGKINRGFFIAIAVLGLIAGLEAFGLLARSQERKQILSRIKELNQSSDLLKEENNNFKKSLEETAKEGLELKIQADQALADALSFKKELEKSKKIVEILNSELKLFKEENNSLGAEISKLKAAFAITNKKLLLTERLLRLNKQKLSRLPEPEDSLLQGNTGKPASLLTAKSSEYIRLEAKFRMLLEEFTALESAGRTLKSEKLHLESEKLSLESQLAEADKKLSQQNEMVSSLKSNLDLMTAALSRKEEEKKALGSELAQANLIKSNTEDKLKQQEGQFKRQQEIIDSQKLKANNLTNILVQKELDLNKRTRDIVVLNEQITSLQAKIDNLERELTYSKEREKMLLQNFGELTKINNNLQGRLGEISTPALGQEDPDKKIAEELMRKMEIIVSPAPEQENKAEDTVD